MTENFLKTQSVQKHPLLPSLLPLSCAGTWYENGKQNKRIIPGFERMVWWWWWRGGLLVKVEKLPGKHLIIAIV